MADSRWKPSFWQQVVLVLFGTALLYLSFRLMCGPHGCDYSQFPRDVHR